MARVEFPSLLDYLMVHAFDGIEDVPLAQSFHRIICGKDGLIPKLQIPPRLRIHVAGTRSQPPRALRPFLADLPFGGFAPSVAVVGGMPEVDNVDGIGAAGAPLDGDHRATRGLRVERAG